MPIYEFEVGMILYKFQFENISQKKSKYQDEYQRWQIVQLRQGMGDNSKLQNRDKLYFIPDLV